MGTGALRPLLVERLARVVAEENEWSVAQLTVRRGLLTEEQLHEALVVQASGVDGRRPLGEILVARGWIGLFRLGRTDEARAELEHSLRLAGNNPLAVYLQACMEADAGRDAEAFALLERAVELGYSGSHIADAQPELARLRNDPRYGRLFHEK